MCFDLCRYISSSNHLLSSFLNLHGCDSASGITSSSVMLFCDQHITVRVVGLNCEALVKSRVKDCQDFSYCYLSCTVKFHPQNILLSKIYFTVFTSDTIGNLVFYFELFFQRGNIHDITFRFRYHLQLKIKGYV